MKASELKAVRDSGAKAWGTVWNHAHGLGGVTGPDDDGLIALLRAGGVSVLDKTGFQALVLNRVQKALDGKDGNFLIRLGRAIQDAGTGIEKPDYNKLDLLLTGLWAPQKDRDWPGLCNFTDEAITEFCALVLQQKNLTEGAVTKRRQRLSLKKSTKPTITDVRRVNSRLVYDRK